MSHCPPPQPPPPIVHSSQRAPSAGYRPHRGKPEQHFDQHLLGPPSAGPSERYHPRVQGRVQSQDSAAQPRRPFVNVSFLASRSGASGTRRASTSTRRWTPPFARWWWAGCRWACCTGWMWPPAPAPGWESGANPSPLLLVRTLDKETNLDTRRPNPNPGSGFKPWVRVCNKELLSQGYFF